MSPLSRLTNYTETITGAAVPAPQRNKLAHLMASRRRSKRLTQRSYGCAFSQYFSGDDDGGISESVTSSPSDSVSVIWSTNLQDSSGEYSHGLTTSDSDGDNMSPVSTVSVSDGPQVQPELRRLLEHQPSHLAPDCSPPTPKGSMEESAIWDCLSRTAHIRVNGKTLTRRPKVKRQSRTRPKHTRKLFSDQPNCDKKLHTALTEVKPSVQDAIDGRISPPLTDMHTSGDPLCADTSAEPTSPTSHSGKLVDSHLVDFGSDVKTKKAAALGTISDANIITGKRQTVPTNFLQLELPIRKRQTAEDSLIFKQSTKKSRHLSAGGKHSSRMLGVHSTGARLLPRSLSEVKLHSTSTKREDRAPVTSPQLKQTAHECVGLIVWARLTPRGKWWPGMTITGISAGQRTATADNQWVFWYGEHKVSEVTECRILPFDKEFSSLYKRGAGAVYTTAVLEAIQECRVHLADPESSEWDCEVPGDAEQLINWAESTFNSTQSVLPQGKLTKFVETKLGKILQMCMAEAEETFKEEASNTVIAASLGKRDPEGNFEKVRLGELDIEQLCIACALMSREVVRTHPVLKGGLCLPCQDAVKESLFSFGPDGSTTYCIICGNGGELLVCDSKQCCRTYCIQCLDTLGGENLRSQCQNADPWLCFVCNSEPTEPLDMGLISIRSDWEKGIMGLFQKSSLLHKLPACNKQRRLRVLSLFDGIGTAKVVLDNLKLDIEAYFCAEIDEDAVQVVDLNHGDSVILLGDVKNITEEKLAELGRIDLLVGGSPCNDLALVNPARKGLYDDTGTGILFFDFYRILMTLMARQPGDTVLWLFENVVHMKSETKQTISRFLECDPVKFKSGYFSAQNRDRYFWGNIPGMYSPLSPEIMGQKILLQDMLSRGREATVGKIRTVTTRGASLLQGKNEDMHAVLMNGQLDKLWPTELERIFGLPVHYTDVGNLAPGRRQKLLGRSWCVPVVEYIMRPLIQMFATKD